MSIRVIYLSLSGNTEEMAKEVLEGIHQAGREADLLEFSAATLDDIRNADALALGCPAKGTEELEEDIVEPLVESMSQIDWSGKKLALFGSYGWGDGEWMRNWQERMQGYGATLVADGVITLENPDRDGIEQCRKLGALLV